RFDDDVAQPRTRGDVDLRRLDLLRRLFAQQVFVRVESRLAFGLACTRRHANPLELALERPLLARLGLLLLLQSILLLLEPRRVVAFPGNAAAAIELEDPAGDVIEEVTIVGDRDDRAGVI